MRQQHCIVRRKCDDHEQHRPSALEQPCSIARFVFKPLRPSLHQPERLRISGLQPAHSSQHTVLSAASSAHSSSRNDVRKLTTTQSAPSPLSLRATGQPPAPPPAVRRISIRASGAADGPDARRILHWPTETAARRSSNGEESPKEQAVQKPAVRQQARPRFNTTGARQSLQLLPASSAACACSHGWTDEHAAGHARERPSATTASAHAAYANDLESLHTSAVANERERRW